MEFETEEEPQQQPPEEETPIDFGQHGEAVEKSIWDEKQHLDIIKHYSEEENIPEELEKRQWAIFNKNFTNTFLEENDLPMISINLEILKINELMSKPAHLQTFKEINELDKMTLHTYFKTKRAIGTNKNKINERTLQNTQISQAIGTQTVNQGEQKKKIFGLI